MVCSWFAVTINGFQKVDKCNKENTTSQCYFKALTFGLTSMFYFDTGSNTCNSLFGDPECTRPLFF